MRPGRTRGWIFTVYGSYDVFSPKDGPFGVATLSEFVWGNIPQKLSKRDVNKQFQAKRAEYKNRDMWKVYKHDQRVT